MESNLSVLAKLDSKDTSVEILQYNTLEGSADLDTSRALYYARMVGMRLKQVRISLRGGEISIEAGALHFMRGALTAESKMEGIGGLAKKMVSNALTGEATFKPRYRGTGEIYLEPTFGHFLLVPLNGEEMVTDKGMFYASEASVSVGVAMQKNVSSALFGGEGFFQTKLTGTGWCVLASPVPITEIVRYELKGEKLMVDGNFALLRKGNIEFRVEKSTKSLLGSVTGGEGFLQSFTGTGEVWLAPTQSVYEQISRGRLKDLAKIQETMGQTTRKTA